jgi:hypothetical protein
VSDEATQRKRNAASFRTSLFRHSNPPAVTAPPYPEPTVDNDAVEIRGIPYWTEQVDPEEISAELDYNPTTWRRKNKNAMMLLMWIGPIRRMHQRPV